MQKMQVPKELVQVALGLPLTALAWMALGLPSALLAKLPLPMPQASLVQMALLTLSKLLALLQVMPAAASLAAQLAQRMRRAMP